MNYEALREYKPALSFSTVAIDRSFFQNGCRLPSWIVSEVIHVGHVASSVLESLKWIKREWNIWTWREMWLEVTRAAAGSLGTRVLNYPGNFYYPTGTWVIEYFI